MLTVPTVLGLLAALLLVALTSLIAIVGTGAGLSLGISSMLSNDIYKTVLRPKAFDRELLHYWGGAVTGCLVQPG